MVAVMLVASPSSTLAQLVDVTKYIPEAVLDLIPEPTVPPTTVPPTTEAAVPETTVPPTTEATVPPTTEAVTEPTETEPPAPESFTLTFVGDCTLGTALKNFNYQQGFILTVGEDYSYNFANVIDYFTGDDFTMLNLEGVLANEGTPAAKQYAFRGPTKYANILTQNSVEAVSLSNNHTRDFLEAGYLSTTTTLTDAGVPYVEQDNTLIVTTDRGLTIGIYAVNYDNLNEKEIVAAISQLEANEEIDLVILCAHWGNENSFKQSAQQEKLAHAAIDAGADIVYGTHTHTLQPIEEYNGGIIFYSLGNFAFGGNNDPKDYDSALVQQEVIRDVDGTIKLGELTVVPCSISSVSHLNNFQPTPYEADSNAYNRAMSKLDGSYAGHSLPIG